MPELHKIVFVPILIPTKELTWKWQYAKEPAKEVPQEYYDDCDELVVSPAVCVPGWKVVE